MDLKMRWARSSEHIFMSDFFDTGSSITTVWTYHCRGYFSFAFIKPLECSYNILQHSLIIIYIYYTDNYIHISCMFQHFSTNLWLNVCTFLWNAFININLCVHSYTFASVIVILFWPYHLTIVLGIGWKFMLNDWL